MERTVNQSWDGDMPILIQRIYFPGTTPMQWQWFTKDYMNKLKEITSPKVLQIEELMMDDGCILAHQRVCPPVPLVAARSSIICYYWQED